MCVLVRLNEDMSLGNIGMSRPPWRLDLRAGIRWLSIGTGSDKDVINYT